MSKPDEKTNTRLLLKERLNRSKKPDASARLLNSWLSEPESSVELDHVLKSLQDNRKDYKQLSACSEVIVKFTYKARLTNRAFDWLQAIERLLQSYQEFRQVVPADLYISKYYCLKTFNNLDPEAENCLHRAIELSRDNEEQIKTYLLFGRYYEDISEYNKMKTVLLKCEELCRASTAEDYLACTWVLLGHYYFRLFNFNKAKKYLSKAQIKLEPSCNKANYNRLSRTLSDCLHFLARLYFEEYKFVDSAILYVKSQNILEKYCKQNSITLDIGATAFYHLRLGQVLEACQIKDSAKYHYDMSQKLFTEIGGGSSSLVHVNLALANLVEHESQSAKESFHKEEKQIKDAANKSLKTGYHRGYLMALLQLLRLYIKNYQIHLVIKIVIQVLLSKEFKNLGTFVVLVSLIYAQKKIIRFYHKIKFNLYYKNFRSDKILYTCPCPDPKCKQVEKVRQAMETGG
ncbi:MAG: hypothetical protein AB1589_10035 [Cyanobacteriota bacterium]